MSKDTNIAFSFFSNHFNQSKSKDYFINPNCFGDDLASWFMEELKKKGVEVEDDGPDQEDFGWYLNFDYVGVSYTCVVLFQEDKNRWHCILEYNSGLIGSLFGKRKRQVPEMVADLFDQILKKQPEMFQAVEWSNRS